MQKDLLLSRFQGPEAPGLMVLGPMGESRPLDKPDWIVERPAAVDDCGGVATTAATILRTHCVLLRFQVVSDSGRVVREITVDRPAVHSTSAELDAYEHRMRQSLAEVGLPPALAEQMIADFRDRHRIKRLCYSIRHDAEIGRYWILEMPEEFGGGPATLHLFDEAGIYLTRLTFDREWADYDAADGRVFALEGDPRHARRLYDRRADPRLQNEGGTVTGNPTRHPGAPRTAMPLLVALLLATGCAGPTEDAVPGSGGAGDATSGAPAPAADTLPPRPDTIVSTIPLEGMDEPMTFWLYRSLETFPVPFTTYVPTDVAAEPIASGDGDAVRFIAEFGGARNEHVFLAVAFPPAGTDEARARELVRTFAAKHGAVARPADARPRYTWSIEEWNFVRELPNRRSAIGTVTLARHGEWYFYVATHFPEEYAEGFGPRAARILDEWRWEDTGEGLGDTVR